METVSILTIISLIVNGLLSGGLIALVTINAKRKQANAEADDAKHKAKRTEIDNNKEIMQTYQKIIVEPVIEELKELRTATNRLKKALEKIGECEYREQCPVKHELNKNKDKNEDNN